MGSARQYFVLEHNSIGTNQLFQRLEKLSRFASDLCKFWQFITFGLSNIEHMDDLEAQDGPFALCVSRL